MHFKAVLTEGVVDMHAASPSIETRLRYLVHDKLFESKAKVVAVGENERGGCFILDETIFYPQGGGQPSDKGRIVANDGRVWTLVKALKEDTCVHHWVIERVGEDMIGQEVTLFVDADTRQVNCAAHTAGHLLAHLVEGMFDSPLIASKGHHFPEGAYVEFLGGLPQGVGKEAFLESLQSKLENTIQNSAIVKLEFASDGGAMPTPKTLRTIEIYGIGKAPCGGTHLHNLRELSQVHVRKMKPSKVGFRISYSATLR